MVAGLTDSGPSDRLGDSRSRPPTVRRDVPIPDGGLAVVFGPRARIGGRGRRRGISRFVSDDPARVAPPRPGGGTTP